MMMDGWMDDDGATSLGWGSANCRYHPRIWLLHMIDLGMHDVIYVINTTYFL